MSGAIVQSGPVTKGHVAVFVDNGVVQDGKAGGQGVISDIGIQNDGGAAITIDSGPDTEPFNQFTISTSSNGVTTFSFNGFGGAPDAEVQFDVNGVIYAFNPASSGNITGPTSVTSGNLLAFNGNTGNLVEDTGIAASGVVSGPSAAVTGDVVAFNGTTGKLIKDTGILAANLVTAPGGGVVISSAMVPVVEAASTAAATSLLNFLSALTDAVARSVTSKLGDFVSVADFGALPSNSDNTTQFQAALNAAIYGGRVIVPAGRYAILNNLTIPAGVSLVGPYSEVGAPGATSFSPPYGSMSAILLAATATITVNGSGVIDGCLIVPNGMTFPQTNSSAWSGSAITVAGQDVVIKNSMIMGFNLGIGSDGFDRLRVADCNMDNNNNIAINASEDTFKISRVHCWPFATFYPSVPYTGLQRNGASFSCANSNDWGKFTDCFCYGYAIGYNIQSCDSVTCLGCGADNVQQGTYGIGFNVIGGSTDTRLIGCQASGHYIGYYLSESVAGNVQTRMIGSDSWGCLGHCVLIDGPSLGDVYILGGMLRDTPNGVTISSATPRVDIDGVTFNDIGSPSTIINCTVPTTNVIVHPNCTFTSLSAGNAIASSNLSIPLVASASAVALPPRGNLFSITGTTGFGTLEGGWCGRMVTLIFGASLTVSSTFSGATTNMRLSGNANLSTAIGTTLTLVHNGTQWFEAGRSA